MKLNDLALFYYAHTGDMALREGVDNFALTFSHISALDTLRTLRSNGFDIRSAEPMRFANPTPWVGKRWTPRTFRDQSWKWEMPSAKTPLHVLVPNRIHRIRMEHVTSGKERATLAAAAAKTKRRTREKAVDDISRNRQLLAAGKVVLPATKEDLYGWGNLDTLTRQVLACAHTLFGADTSEYVKILEDTERARDRHTLLASLLPSGASWGSSHGKL